jgi:hypothetical protein
MFNAAKYNSLLLLHGQNASPPGLLATAVKDQTGGFLSLSEVPSPISIDCPASTIEESTSLEEVDTPEGISLGRTPTVAHVALYRALIRFKSCDMSTSAPSGPDNQSICMSTMRSRYLPGALDMGNEPIDSVRCDKWDSALELKRIDETKRGAFG